MNPEVTAAMEADAQTMRDAGHEFEQPYLSAKEAIEAADHRLLVVCDSCRQVVEDNHDDRVEWVTPCPHCGGETATYSPRCGEDGCTSFAYALMPGVGSRCKPHWRRLMRQAEREAERPGARGRKSGKGKKRKRARR